MQWQSIYKIGCHFCIIYIYYNKGIFFTIIRVIIGISLGITKILIIKNIKWLDIPKLALYEELTYVVYYLIDDINKEIYIGGAKRFGDRVKLGRQEIPGWNKFRYELIHQRFH